MNLVMVLPWMKVSFEVWVGIQIPYTGKKEGWCIATLDVHDIGKWLEKMKSGGERLFVRRVSILNTCAIHGGGRCKY